MRITTIITILTALLLSACSGAKAGDTAGEASRADTIALRKGFSADSAMTYLRRQVEFGPRVPGSQAHKDCREWLTATLRGFGATTQCSSETVATADGSTTDLYNILASFNPDASERILLLAHYDTRPQADNDPDPAHQAVPFDGANDGASGVAVLLEIARNLAIEAPDSIGVDILLTDLEDSGNHTSDDSWCIGSQQFAKGNPAARYRYGILLDMVGGREARFNREYYSAHSAPLPTARVWDMARRLGLEKRFPMQIGGAINDDHLPLIRAGLQVTDIIESANPSTGSFNPTWHTHNDNIDNIDPATMADVGTVVMNVLYNEKP